MAETVRAVPSYICARFPSVTAADALITLNVLVTLGAGFQPAFPACEATTATVPAPVKDIVEPFVIAAGPLATLNATGKPLEAVADNASTWVATCAPIAGKSMVWLALATVVTLVTAE